MSNEHRDAEDQESLWNGTAGHAWVQAQAVLDGMFQPFEDRLVQHAAAGCRVLDVGCGTGSTTLALSRRAGPGGRTVGIDLSAPMLAIARARASQQGIAAHFIHADAQTHAFNAAEADLIVSRFGVMFFNDPVRAFSNLRHAARQDAELRFFAWRAAAENPFMTLAERVAGPMLPGLPARRPGAPGQFAFADSARVHSILDASGWNDIDIQAIDVDCAFPEHELTRYLSLLGPVGAALQRTDESRRNQVLTALRAAFAPHVHAGEVHFNAACWNVGARAA